MPGLYLNLWENKCIQKDVPKSENQWLKVVNVAQNATKVHAGMSIEYLSNIAQINLI